MLYKHYNLNAINFLGAFGRILRQLRAERSISQQQLASAFGMQRTAITNYESGKSLPSLELFVEIVKLFDVSSDLMLGFPTPVQLEHIKPKNSNPITTGQAYAWVNEQLGASSRTPEEQARIARLECRLDVLLKMAGTLSAEV